MHMSHDQRLAQVFVELAGPLTDDFHLHDFGQTLAERCVELVDVDAGDVLLVDPDGSLQLVASTSEDANAWGMQTHGSRGPYLSCFSCGRAVANVAAEKLLGEQPGDAVGQRGFSRVHALPLWCGEQVLGVLTLLSRSPGELAADQVAMAQALADVAAIALAHELKVRDLIMVSGQLQTALDSRILIEQAKGVLAERAQISVCDAFTVMRNHARRSGQPLRVVARDVVAGSCTPLR